MAVLTQSEYLIISNKLKVSKLINKSPLTEEGDFIDILIGLHIILEVGLNSFFRQVSLLSIKKNIDRLEIMDNIDKVGFIDKTILFIYNSKFDFGTEIEEAIKHHKIIGILRNFAETRNKLLHGHAIATFHTEENRIPRLSRSRKILNLNFLQEQITRFRKILAGMRFYLDHLDSPITESGKQDLAESYLDDSFIPEAVEL
ncbi:MAG: hypothetical protein UY92_C0015G0057 [Candidatus Magasanikbacteria bacterium GW2011_GWA2_56_11]|uniref:Uncharacterized protein n=1 Tax=Candidatus Magasanikbacteria bacterium GW2011_GWA2_56_11 TaxID=1619044 RepID=A0A0G1YEP7_9BACT|nr:MAG: hypothetical protein UY92_C0015G0057 [Candidatus Magasanikbacteria bacterium GW2011_GWA2_56_11]